MFYLLLQIHELTQQQTRTIESVVPWFLNAMPVRNSLCFFFIIYFSQLKGDSDHDKIDFFKFTESLLQTSS